MSEFFRQPLTITRLQPGSRDSKGRWVDGTDGPVIVSASVRPFGGGSLSQADQLLLQEQGLQSVDGLLRVYSTQELYTVDETTGQLADRFEWDGRRYHIVSRMHFGRLLPHWRCVAQLIPENVAP